MTATADDLEIVPLTPETWPLFEALAAKHNGVWGGCWCSWFHDDTDGIVKKELGSQGFTRAMVEAGHAHTALVVKDGAAIAWCEYGTVAELPIINHRKQRDALQAATEVPTPRYRITCFFVDRDHRRTGVAERALDGALELIAQAGGGLVESYPHDPDPGVKTSASFLHNGTRRMFERHGFTYLRPLGTVRTLMQREVAPA